MAGALNAPVNVGAELKMLMPAVPVGLNVRSRFSATCVFVSGTVAVFCTTRVYGISNVRGAIARGTPTALITSTRCTASCTCVVGGVVLSAPGVGGSCWLPTVVVGLAVGPVEPEVPPVVLNCVAPSAAAPITAVLPLERSITITLALGVGVNAAALPVPVTVPPVGFALPLLSANARFSLRVLGTTAALGYSSCATKLIVHCAPLASSKLPASSAMFVSPSKLAAGPAHCAALPPPAGTLKLPARIASDGAPAV